MTEAELQELTEVFPSIPVEPIRRAVEITGSANAASAWLLENDWRELVESQQAGMALVLGSGEHNDEHDDESDGSDAESEGGQASSRRPPAEAEPQPKRARKLVTQEGGSPAVEGAPSFWCGFDTTTVHKDHLQLMNLRPQSLGHSRIALTTHTPQETSREAAERALADVWAHCVPTADPGYWLVPVAFNDLDDVWWSILGPHLLQKLFGQVVVLETLPIAGRETPRFDELDDRSANGRRPPHLPRRSAPSGSSSDAVAVAAVLVLASGARRDLQRVGNYLAALFPKMTPLYFRRLRSTANAYDDASGRGAAFAHDPRADSDYLEPSWHQNHADYRVSRQVDYAKPDHDKLAFAQLAPRAKFVLEQRSAERASDWAPLPPEDGD